MVTWTGANAQADGIEGLQSTKGTATRPIGDASNYVYISGDRATILDTGEDYLRHSGEDFADEDDV